MNKKNIITVLAALLLMLAFLAAGLAVYHEAHTASVPPAAFLYHPDTQDGGVVCPGDRIPIEYEIVVNDPPVAANVTLTVWPADRTDAALLATVARLGLLGDDSITTYHYPFTDSTRIRIVWVVPDLPAGVYDRIVMAQFNSRRPAWYSVRFTVGEDC